MATSSEAVLELVRKKYQPGHAFTARELNPNSSNLHSLQNSLWVLSKKGFLDKPRGKGSRGKYILRGRKAPTKTNGKSHSTDPEQVIIDELLDCMARAEPILKKWSAIREALKGI